MCRTMLFVAVAFLVHVVQGEWMSPGDLRPIAPGGDYVLIGQQLVMKCSLNETGPYNSSQLYIEKGNDFNGSSSIIDRWSILMNDTVTGLNYTGTYFCWADAGTFIGSQEVAVEYYPQPVSNLTCVKYNWDGWLNCSYEMGVDYVDITDIDVNFLYVTSVPRPVYKCPTATSTSHYCYWDTFYNTQISIIVKVNNTRANVSVRGKLHTFKMTEIVKPAPVDFSHFERTSRSITVFWSHEKSFRTKIYRLQYSGENQEILIQSSFAPGEKEQDRFNHMFLNLHPYTEYKFRLDVKPLTGGYWSDPIFRSEKTLQDVPDTGPVVTPGSMYQQPCSEGGRRDVTIYWREPEPLSQNGILTGYSLSVDNINATTDQHRFNYTFPNLSCDDTHVVRLNAKTSVGWSLNETQIIIPAGLQSASLLQDFYILLSDTDSEVKAVWKPVESFQGEISQYYLYWCNGTKLLQRCETKINWMVVGGNTTSAILPISLSAVDGALFGISMTIDSVSSGISWAPCIVKNIIPSHKPRGLLVDKSESKTSLKVKWTNSRCLDDGNGRALVTQYRLVVKSIVNGKGDIKGEYVYNFTTNEHTETNLQIGTNYSFQIQALSDMGAGPFSDPVFETIPYNSFGMDKMVPILSSLAVVLPILITVCYCLCHKDKVKKYFEKYQISMPKMPSPTHEPLQSQVSNTPSFNDVTDRTAATEEYLMNFGSGSASSNSMESSSNRSGNSIDNCNPQQTTNIRLSADADMIEVTTMNPGNTDIRPCVPAGAQGKGPCSGYAKPEDLMHLNKDYSLFSDRTNHPVVGQVQHPDYASPEAATAFGGGGAAPPPPKAAAASAATQVQIKSPQSAVVQPPSGYVKADMLNNAPSFHSDYITESQIVPNAVHSPDQKEQTTIKPVVMHQDYVTVPLTGPPDPSNNIPLVPTGGTFQSGTSRSDLGSGSGSGSSSRPSSESAQSYVKADIEMETPSSGSRTDMSTGPAVLQSETLPSAEVTRRKVSDYVPNNLTTTKL